jgi:hypothetical protein
MGGIAGACAAWQPLSDHGQSDVLGATLTLPGIAGIVLTVGMAVDSNVLIYERMREERGRALDHQRHPVRLQPGASARSSTPT